MDRWPPAARHVAVAAAGHLPIDNSGSLASYNTPGDTINDPKRGEQLDMCRGHGWLGISSVKDPDEAEGPGILVASLPDLAATKVTAVQSRPSARDYIDLDALLRSGLTLDDALGAASAVFGPEFNPLLTLKALTFYGEGDLNEVPDAVRENLTKAAVAVDLQSLPVFRPRARLCPDEAGTDYENGF